MLATVTEADLPELLPLMRGYCHFYEVDPSDDALLAISRDAEPSPDQGLQLIARDDPEAARSASRRSSGPGRCLAPLGSA